MAEMAITALIFVGYNMLENIRPSSHKLVILSTSNTKRKPNVLITGLSPISLELVHLVGPRASDETMIIMSLNCHIHIA